MAAAGEMWEEGDAGLTNVGLLAVICRERLLSTAPEQPARGAPACCAGKLTYSEQLELRAKRLQENA